MEEEYFDVSPHSMQDVKPDLLEEVKNAHNLFCVQGDTDDEDQPNYLDVDPFPHSMTDTLNESSLDRKQKAAHDIMGKLQADGRCHGMAKHDSLDQHGSIHNNAYEAARWNGLENGLYDDGLQKNWSLLTKTPLYRSLLTKNPLYKGSDEDDTVYSTVEQLTERLPTRRKKKTLVSLARFGRLAAN